jgi:acyl-CoA dehydrogenase
MENEELTLFRDMARRALEKEISPHIEAWEAEHMVPRELWNTLGTAGLLCPDMPEEYGAAGTTPQVTFAIIEEISRMGFGGIASGYGIHSNIVAPYIEHFGSEAQKQQWLPKMVSGEVPARTVTDGFSTAPRSSSPTACLRTW